MTPLDHARKSAQIIRLLREDETNARLIRTRIEDHARENKGFYAEVLKLLTHLEFDDDEAKTHWESIIDHVDDMAEKLGRDVGLRVALLDYFTHINKQIENPKIIEISIFEQTMESAMTDALTGIYNRRYFEENLFREYQRAKRYNLVLSVLMIDIDHFKSYNDTYGHPEGDLVLREVADIIRKCCRDSDIPCRYGGEEFCIIMPETIGPDGIHLARRIGNMVKSYSSLTDEKSVWRRQVTLSGGIASFPIDAKYPKEIVQKADIALYQAKRDGRDRAYLYYEERRRYARIDLNFVVGMDVVSGSETPSFKAQTKNIGVGGVLLETGQTFPIGSIMELELRIPEMDRNVKALTKVIRVEARDDGNFDMGLTFIEISDNDLKELDKYINGLLETRDFSHQSERV